jgi:6-phosphogluconolactonase
MTRRKRPDLRVCADVDGAAADVVAAAVGSGGTLVLAGGSTPRGAYARLVARDDVDWARVEVLFGDERCVPPDDPASNYRMAREALLDHVPAARVHRIPVELGAARAVEEYEKVVAAAPHLDVVLLGLGHDGHTLSLFPGGPELASERLVVASRSPAPPPERVSLTLRALDRARQIVFLVKGEAKREVLQRVLEGDEGLPAARVRDPVWLVDAEASGRGRG